MKIRTGFVSNSSSSSFLLGFRPEYISFNEFLKHTVYMYPEDEINLNSPLKDWKTYSETPLTYRQCFSRLWKDLLRKKKAGQTADMKEWYRYIKGKSIPTVSPMEEYIFPFIETSCAPSNISNYWEWASATKIENKLQRAGNIWNCTVGTALFRDYKQRYGKEIYVLGYADEDGPKNALMEHGDFWQYIPHIQFSQH
jgi:hypothetical protein